jgi:hypothetical protein
MTHIGIELHVASQGGKAMGDAMNMPNKAAANVDTATTPPSPSVTQPLSPGWQTSEGQIAGIVCLVQTLIFLLASFNLLHLTDEQQKAIAQIIPITLTATAGFYGLSRAHVKASAVAQPQSTSTVVSAIGETSPSAVVAPPAPINLENIE